MLNRNRLIEALLDKGYSKFNALMQLRRWSLICWVYIGFPENVRFLHKTQEKDALDYFVKVDHMRPVWNTYLNY